MYLFYMVSGLNERVGMRDDTRHDFFFLVKKVIGGYLQAHICSISKAIFFHSLLYLLHATDI
jgi:hypothetical protein